MSSVYRDQPSPGHLPAVRVPCQCLVWTVYGLPGSQESWMTPFAVNQVEYERDRSDKPPRAVFRCSCPRGFLVSLFLAPRLDRWPPTLWLLIPPFYTYLKDIINFSGRCESARDLSQLPYLNHRGSTRPGDSTSHRRHQHYEKTMHPGFETPWATAPAKS